MRVLFVIGGLSFGGAESQVIAVSKELVRLGHEATIYALNGEAARIDELSGSGVEVILDQKRKRLDFGVLARLRSHIRSSRPDIVHGFKFDGDLYARLAAAATRVPVLNSERTENQAVPISQRIGYRLTSFLCDGVVANTYAGAHFARRLHRMREEQVDVVWNGIDVQEVAARVARSDKPAQQVFSGDALRRICMIASIKPENDYALALRVLRRLVDEDHSWRLICVGEEPASCRGYKAKVLAERERLALAPFVEFVGHRRDVLELIASSDLLLMTPVQAGFPNVALEAMACGVPVISTDYGDVRRLLPVAEQVIATRDDADIAAAILHCERNRVEIAKAQRQWFERHGTAAAATAALLAVYAKHLWPGLRLEPV